MNYDLLEQIKDGQVFASKYNSQELKFKIHNAVAIFDIQELARDRWKIFSIEINELVDRRISETRTQTVIGEKRYNYKTTILNINEETKS